MARTTAIAHRINALTGAEKVAIFMLAVGNEHAGKMISRLDGEEQREVVRAMATMGMISADLVERLLLSFIEGIGNPNVYGSLLQAEQILRQIMGPDQVKQILDEIRGSSTRNTWERLHAVPDAQLAAFLRAESPQTAAFVLTKLPPSQGARVISQLPKGSAEDVVKRVINLTPVAKPIVEDLERVLRSEFLVNIGQNRNTDNHAVVAEIMNQLDHELETSIFEQLDKEMPESAERIRRLMFTFDDLEEIDDVGIQLLIREIPNGVLPLALKGARVEMHNLFLRNMAERTGRMLREEIESMPKVKARDIEEARRSIIAICKQLIARGEISAGDDDELDMIE